MTRQRERPLSEVARGVALGAHVVLIAILLVIGGSLSWLAAILLVPAVPGMVRRRVYSFQWNSLLVAFYCALWLADGYARPDHRLLAFGVAAVAAIDFVSLVLFVRLRQREHAARAAGSGAASR